MLTEPPEHLIDFFAGGVGAIRVSRISDTVSSTCEMSRKTPRVPARLKGVRTYRPVRLSRTVRRASLGESHSIYSGALV